MKHIVARAFSTVRTNFIFGAPGLGDRIHHILFAYNYSVMEDTPVTLHLTKHQWNRQKPSSWPEILSLFPGNRVKVIPHLEYEPKNNLNFLEYVKKISLFTVVYMYNCPTSDRKKTLIRHLSK